MERFYTIWASSLAVYDSTILRPDWLEEGFWQSSKPITNQQCSRQWVVLIYLFSRWLDIAYQCGSFSVFLFCSLWRFTYSFVMSITAYVIDQTLRCIQKTRWSVNDKPQGKLTSTEKTNQQTKAFKCSGFFGTYLYKYLAWRWSECAWENGLFREKRIISEYLTRLSISVISTKKFWSDLSLAGWEL